MKCFDVLSPDKIYSQQLGLWKISQHDLYNVIPPNRLLVYDSLLQTWTTTCWIVAGLCRSGYESSTNILRCICSGVGKTRQQLVLE